MTIHKRRPRPRRISRTLAAPALSLGLLALGACTHASDDARRGGTRSFEQDPGMADGTGPSDPSVRASTATNKLGAQDLSPKLVGSDYFGELCPENSLVVNEATDGSALSLSFAAGLDARYGAELEGSCQVRLSLKVPEGSSFGNVYLYGTGYSYSTAGGASLSVDYSFAGQSEKQTASRSLGQSDGSFVFYDVMDRVWSPSCGADVGVVDLVLELKGRVSGETYLGLTSVEIGLSYIDGAQFMRCADRSLIRPPPSEEGEPCAGPPKHPCAAGFECDLFDAPHDHDALLTGVCARGSEQLEAMPEYGPCNGLRRIACQPGLQCHYSSAARAATKSWNGSGEPAQLVGYCTPEVGRDGDKCAGYPEIKCAAGHFCSPSSRDVCKAWTGELGSACEEGIAGCHGELVCQSQHCEVPFASEGDRCGGPLEIDCIAGSVCVENVCVPDPNRGKAGSACFGPDDCDANLTCYVGKCRDSIAGLGGTSCAKHEDCIPGFYCTSSNKCHQATSGILRSECTFDADCYPGLHCDGGYCAEAVSD